MSRSSKPPSWVSSPSLSISEVSLIFNSRRDLFDEFAVRDITPDLEAGESVELEARGLHGSGQRGRPQRSGGHNSHMKGPSGRGHGPARHRKSPNHRYALDVVLPYLSADKSLQERIR